MPMREFELLQHVYAANAGLSGRVLIPPGDDMGMVKLSRQNVLAAVDQIVDGRHVQISSTPLALVGRKAVARSLSDIAAMAARPVATLAAAVLPPDFGADRANELFDAMRATADQYHCPLIGGDLAFHAADAAHPLVCSVTVLAEPADDHQPITRSGARAGDTVYVTGSLGGSLQADGLGRHLTFEPRIELALDLGRLLGDRLHAMIDISDGLGRDASHIAQLSGVQIRLDAAAIPCHEGCDWRNAISDGEDYELCFTASGPVPQRIGDTAITPVGEVVSSPPGDNRLVLVQHEGTWLAADELGWEHSA